MAQNQRGFGIVQLLLILVLVGLIAGTGYYVYDARKALNKSTDDTSSQKAEMKTDDDASGGENNPDYDTSGWEMTVISSMIAFKVPDGWQLSNQDGDLVYSGSSESLEYKPGTPAIIEKTTGGRDGAFRFFAQVLTPQQAAERSFDAYEKQGTVKTDSYTADKYYRVVANEFEGMGPPSGSKEYVYYFAVDNDHYGMITYTIYPGDEERLDIVEAAVKTVKRPGA